jgi:hypothetical protein
MTADVTPTKASTEPLHRHKRVVMFIELRARVRASAREAAHAQQHVKQRRDCISCPRIIVIYISRPAAAAAAAALMQSTPSHYGDLVSVHNHVVTSKGIDRNSSDEALTLGAFPPVLEHTAFVRHAAGDVTAAVAGSCCRCCFEDAAREGGTQRAPSPMIQNAVVGSCSQRAVHIRNTGKRKSVQVFKPGNILIPIVSICVSHSGRIS